MFSRTIKEVFKCCPVSFLLMTLNWQIKQFWYNILELHISAFSLFLSLFGCAHTLSLIQHEITLHHPLTLTFPRDWEVKVPECLLGNQILYSFSVSRESCLFSALQPITALLLNWTSIHCLFCPYLNINWKLNDTESILDESYSYF